MRIAQDQSGLLSSSTIDFSAISLTNPVTATDRQAGLDPHQQAAADRFAMQRDGVTAAMLVVNDLHRASNAENANNGEFSPPACSSMLCIGVRISITVQIHYPPISWIKCGPAITPRPSFFDNTGPLYFPLPLSH